MRKEYFATLLLLVATSLCLFAAESSPQDHVRATVTVVGGDGVPVSNLTKSDFSIQDSGKPRTIDGFEGPNGKPAKIDVGPNEFSNGAQASDGGAIFLVLDTIHSRYVDERDTREVILKFLGKAAQANQAVLLGILNEKGLRVYHDYRSGSNVLIAALAKAGLGGVKGAAPLGPVNDAEVTAEAARLTAFSKGDLSNALPQDRPLLYLVDAPLTMFQNVANAGYGLPGRKSLVWVTNAVPFDINSKTMVFESPKEASQGAAVNGVSVAGSKSALSADQIKKILPLWRTTMAELFQAGVAVYPVETRGSFPAGNDTQTISVIKTLAQLTGGKAFYGSSDPFPEILQIAKANAAGYTLTYGADAGGTDFRRIDVTIKNPAYTVNRAPGYFPLQIASNQVIGTEISAAMDSPLDYTGVFFKVAVAGMEDAGAGKKKVNLTISLAGDSGVMNESLRKVDIGLVAVAKNAAGETVGKMNEGAGGQFPPEAVAQIKELGFQLKRSMEIPAGDCVVHLMIRDNQNGRMGTVVFPMKVQ